MPPVCTGVEELTPEQVHRLVREEVTKATKPRISREHVRLLKVCVRFKRTLRMSLSSADRGSHAYSSSWMHLVRAA